MLTPAPRIPLPSEAGHPRDRLAGQHALGQARERAAHVAHVAHGDGALQRRAGVEGRTERGVILPLPAGGKALGIRVTHVLCKRRLLSLREQTKEAKKGREWDGSHIGGK
jgi:hypothetical protein